MQHTNHPSLKLCTTGADVALHDLFATTWGVAGLDLLLLP